jgi:hypothetical protein
VVVAWHVQGVGFNVIQDVGLQLEVHRRTVRLVKPIPWEVADKLAELVDHVQGGSGDVRCGRAKHLCLSQNSAVAVEASHSDEPHEKPAFSGVTHQGDYVGPA